MPGLRWRDDPDPTIAPHAGGVSRGDVQGAPLPAVPEDMDLGAADADQPDGGAGTGPDRAMGWFAADAERLGMSLTSYLRRYGIIGPFRDRRIRRHEATGLDLEAMEDCD